MSSPLWPDDVPETGANTMSLQRYDRKGEEEWGGVKAESSPLLYTDSTVAVCWPAVIAYIFLSPYFTSSGKGDYSHTHPHSIPPTVQSTFYDRATPVYVG